MDDYLLVTTNRSKAQAFLEMMIEGDTPLRHDFSQLELILRHAGNPEYGCFISSEKTRTNFEFGSSDPAMITEPDQKGQERLTSWLNFSRLTVVIRFPLVRLCDRHG